VGLVALLVAVLVAVLVGWGLHGGTAGPDPGAPGLPAVSLAALPADVGRTVELIEAGGPFPYDQDGSTFENREGLLPGEARGFYREYTVRTPGSDDRGARRIVVGGDTMYYTDDHYRSFRRIEVNR
jgi:ribonuclease T1